MTVRLAALKDIPEKSVGILRRTVGGVDIGLFRQGDEIFAWRNVCPHEGAPVCLGDVAGTRLPSSVGSYVHGREGEVLRCPWHGWEFSVTTGDHLAEGSFARLREYPILISGDYVYDASGLAVDRVLRVQHESYLAHGVRRLELSFDDDDPLPSWMPGAHVELRLPSGRVRHFSICNGPSKDNRLVIAVRADEGGRGGSREVVHHVSVGDVLVLLRIRNNFVLKPAKRYLFLAGGIGITALLEMIHAVRRRGCVYQVYYIDRDYEAMAFRDVLSGDPNVSTIFTATSGRPNIRELIRGTAEGTKVYCCGPPGMLREAEGAGEAFGRDVTVERFAEQANVVNATLPNRAFEVRFERSGIVTTVGPSESILEAAEAAGIRAKFSCREGWCASCETGVVAGIPEHRDRVLSEEERSEGNSMMICVGRARTARLVLDL